MWPFKLFSAALLLPLKIDNLKQAWAILRCVVSMIYLNMITLAVCNEILHTRLLYSLKINFGTKKFFWPSCDLLLDFIVLVKDLGLTLMEKIQIYVHFHA